YLDKNGKFVCLSGDNIKKALTNFKILSIEEKTKDLTGTVASRGKVTGRVAIVKGVKDLVKVKNGDILVAVTMHPDFVPAMRRAVAIVTDEGGITSHAAIVSREFGIPCIVGTKNATDILKDGDRVEVDAIKGIIKINP
ncbi:phosphoenolpyruvate synthase, partial [Candidatus Gottesmanbacteria bacterium]|nr:phosphoenolpyruvate synthase [Candidatus Gottesmanbacteria bacterium]